MISKLGQDSTCEIYYPEAQRPWGTCPRSPTGKWLRHDSASGGLVAESVGEVARKIDTRSGHGGIWKAKESSWVFFGWVITTSAMGVQLEDKDKPVEAYAVWARSLGCDKAVILTKLPSFISIYILLTSLFGRLLLPLKYEWSVLVLWGEAMESGDVIFADKGKRTFTNFSVSNI